MSARYLLTCPGCQKQVPVEAGRAGGNVTCECGQTIEVPTMRALKALPQESPPAATESTGSPATAGDQASNWGAKQGVLLLGLVLLIAGGIPTVYKLATFPEPPFKSQDQIRDIAEMQFDQMNLTQSWQVWKNVIEEQGLTTQPTMYEAHYESQLAEHMQWVTIFGVVTGIGFLMLLVGLFIRN